MFCVIFNICTLKTTLQKQNSSNSKIIHYICQGLALRYTSRQKPNIFPVNNLILHSTIASCVFFYYNLDMGISGRIMFGEISQIDVFCMFIHQEPAKAKNCSQITMNQVNICYAHVLQKSPKFQHLNLLGIEEVLTLRNSTDKL